MLVLETEQYRIPGASLADPLTDKTRTFMTWASQFAGQEHWAAL